jgi:hypothetical protein
MGVTKWATQACTIPRISHIIGSGYYFLFTTLFNSLKSLTQRTLPSVLGVMKVGLAHSLAS